MFKVNLVVVNYNNSECTDKMLDSLLDCSDFIESIYIIDNCSDKEEKYQLSFFEKKFESLNLHVIYLDKNVGYFPGLNIGLDFIKNKNQPVIVGNNDIIFNRSFFINLEKIRYEDDLFAISPSLVTSDGVYQNPAQINKPSKFKKIFYSLYFKNYYVGVFLYKIWQCIGLGATSKMQKDNIEKDIYIGMGALYILLPAFFYRNETLDYPFFLYGEEAFLSHQIESSGGRLRYVPALELIHLESVATSKLPTKNKYLLLKKAYLKYKYFWG